MIKKGIDLLKNTFPPAVTSRPVAVDASLTWISWATRPLTCKSAKINTSKNHISWFFTVYTYRQLSSQKLAPKFGMTQKLDYKNWFCQQITTSHLIPIKVCLWVNILKLQIWESKTVSKSHLLFLSAICSKFKHIDLQWALPKWLRRKVANRLVKHELTGWLYSMEWEFRSHWTVNG